MTEAQNLIAAIEGDRRAFDQLVDAHRRELHAHCYRMLGSVHDADDALQDTLLRAWRGLPGFAQRSSLRTWLYAIATNACLALIERNGRRHVPLEIGASNVALDEPDRQMSWLEPYPGTDPGDSSPGASLERRESVELAFVAAFQLLPANQRAVLLLRDVLDFSAEETAVVLGSSLASVNSALARARRRLRDRRPDRSQQATLRALGDERISALVTAYVDAWQRRDPASIVSLLTEDALFSMPPHRVWYQGTEAIAGFLVEVPLTSRWRLLPVEANGQLGFACYVPDETGWRAHSIDVLTIRADRIAHLATFLEPGLVERFGLPGRLPA